ncbi:DMT family transporter [Achromobacter pestifer]|uniref:EamA domain-containing protein n=1 Tax=Achromobacter pestifer TaxID=1353889 RepID=A0A6S7A818_9BURK|nr:DMT family transporter [Achromobacter pestifer]CAB3707145.1 hypothetical protein LMG3431_05773 [Achromobacter pestifer]
MPSSITSTGGDTPRSSPVVAGMLWACLTIAIFSGWFVVTRFSVTRELSLWDVTALRYGIGAIILAPALFRTNKPLPAAQWREGFLYAVLWGAPFVLLVALGLKLTSAAQAASAVPTLMPVCAGMMAWLFLKERPSRIRGLGYLAIVAGLTCMLLFGTTASSAPSAKGVIALLSASAMWSGYTLLFRRSRLTAIQSAALICFWSAVIFVPLYVLFGLSRLALASWQEIALQAFYQGILMSGVAIFSFNRSVTILGPSAATSLVALVPVAALLLGIPVLGEIPSVAECAAMGAVVIGVFLAARPAKPFRAPRPHGTP